MFIRAGASTTLSLDDTTNTTILASDLNVGGIVTSSESVVVSGSNSSLATLRRNSGAGWLELFEGDERRAYLGYESTGGNGIAAGTVGKSTVLRATSGPLYLIGSSGSANAGLKLGSSGASLGYNLDISGNLTVDGDIVGAGANVIRRAQANEALVLRGGDSAIDGAGSHYYGSSHATKANDLEFLSGATVTLKWDDSATEWDFNNYNLRGVGGLELSQPYIRRNSSNAQLQLAGGSATNDGANIILNGSSFPSIANDFDFRSGSTTVLRWDDSAAQWDFQGNRIYNTKDIYGASDTSELQIYGSTNTESANILLYGGSHATKAYDLHLRTGTSDRLMYDNSADLWKVGAAGITKSNTSGSMWLSGGPSTLQGASIRLIGNGALVQANDIEFRADASIVAQWDNSEDLWDYKDKSIVGVNNLAVGGNITIDSRVGFGYRASDAAINGLLGGTTSFGLIEGPNSGHMVIGVRGNGVDDSFAIVGTAAGSPYTYDALLFKVEVNGDVTVGNDLDVGGDVTADTLTVNDFLQLTELTVEPSSPTNGMIVYADGTTWNPGGGEGIYGRVNGAWSKMT